MYSYLTFPLQRVGSESETTLSIVCTQCVIYLTLEKCLMSLLYIDVSL